MDVPPGGTLCRNVRLATLRPLREAHPKAEGPSNGPALQNYRPSCLERRRIKPLAPTREVTAAGPAREEVSGAILQRAGLK